MVKRREDLTSALGPAAATVQYDSDTIGRVSETVARNFGTGRFLVIQTGHRHPVDHPQRHASWRCSGTRTRSSC